MSGKQMKRLRRMAREEMLEDPAVEYVAGPKSRRTMVNSPNSVRGMYLALKKAYVAMNKGKART